MSIYMNNLCAECFYKRWFQTIRKFGTEEQQTAITKEIMNLFSQRQTPVTSAELGMLTDKAVREYFGLEADRLKEEKDFSNRFVLERLDTIGSKINARKDPVFAALQFAILGNYLDFSALQGKLSFEDLEQMLENALEMDLSGDTYRQFRADLEKGKNLLYITDNAGEIVFDRLFAQQLKKSYPHLEITFMVRGGPMSNDATRADAAAAGITFPVIDSGAALGGILEEFISPEAKAALDSADVIIAKGMGNTESMLGCGRNVYYGFLVKCSRFEAVFQKPLMSPMFVRELG